jgi:hypothetical protein
MFSSSAAATAEAMTGAPRRARATNGFAGRCTGNESGRSEAHRSFWESPQSGAFKAAHKRACKGGREVRTWVSDGPAMDRSGRSCSIIFAAGFIQIAQAG